MIGIIIALAILLIAETIWLFVLWRQHLRICRQLRFVREEDSSLLVAVNFEGHARYKLRTNKYSFIFLYTKYSLVYTFDKWRFMLNIFIHIPGI